MSAKVLFTPQPHPHTHPFYTHRVCKHFKFCFIKLLIPVYYHMGNISSVMITLFSLSQYLYNKARQGKNMQMIRREQTNSFLD